MLGMWRALQEHVISLCRGSGLRARVATGPEPDAHRREEPSECHGQDASPWVVRGKKKRGHTTHNPFCFGPHELPQKTVSQEKKGLLSHLFNNASTVTGSATVKAAAHSFHTSRSTFMRSVQVRAAMPSRD